MELLGSEPFNLVALLAAGGATVRSSLPKSLKMGGLVSFAAGFFLFAGLVVFIFVGLLGIGFPLGISIGRLPARRTLVSFGDGCKCTGSLLTVRHVDTGIFVMVRLDGALVGLRDIFFPLF
jgi:hypothetical protein